MTIENVIVTLPMLQWPNEIWPFAEWLKRDVHPCNILEIGTGPGGTAMLFSQICSGLTLSLDLPSGATTGPDLAHCIERNKKLSDALPRFKGLLGDSHAVETKREVFALLGQVDLLFIDGDHRLDGLVRDIADYGPLVRPGGWIAVHDINAKRFGDDVAVWKFWESFENASKREWSVNGDWGGIGAWQV